MENQVAGAITQKILEKLREDGFPTKPKNFFNFQNKDNGGIFNVTTRYFFSDQFVVEQVPALVKIMPPGNVATFNLTDQAHKLAVGFVFYEIAKDSPTDYDFYRNVVYAEEREIYEKRQILEKLIQQD